MSEKMHQICIWDDSAPRINAMEPNLRVALQKLGLKAQVNSNCEPPLLARNNLTGRTPVVQLDEGDFWTHTIGETVTTEQFTNLLKRWQFLGRI